MAINDLGFKGETCFFRKYNKCDIRNEDSVYSKRALEICLAGSIRLSP